MKRIILPTIDPEKVSREIGDFIVERIVDSGRNGGVIGLSGGVDSTTSAALTKKAFDRYNEGKKSKLELVGYMLPSSINAEDDLKDGLYVARTLGIRHEIVNLEPIVLAHESTNPEAFRNKYDKGNLISRVRANVLNTKAATEYKLVVGTGNKDEDFGVGYYTLFGDGAVHISPLGGLSKRLVRQMAEHLGFPQAARREPAPGLEVGQTAFKDLGYRYDFVELFYEGLLQGFDTQELRRHRQILNSANEQMREYKTIFGKRKFTSMDNLFNDLLKRKTSAEKKSELLHPPTPKISLIYDGVEKYG